MIHQERVEQLNSLSTKKGTFVLYWMQQAQRAQYNHALEFAIDRANELQLPILVGFCITPTFPEANQRSYKFMLDGLDDTIKQLSKRGIQTIICYGEITVEIPKIAQKAALVITDKGYLQFQRGWRIEIASKIDCPLLQVDTDCVVPVSVASVKEEYAAKTIRPKITKLLSNYLVPLETRRVNRDSLKFKMASLKLPNVKKVILETVDSSVSGDIPYLPGPTKALQTLEIFIQDRLDNFAVKRNDPSMDYQSNLSPYLHFGHISPLQIALEIQKRPGEGKEAFLEQLIIRRELSINFVWYNKSYNSFAGLPDWAQKTLTTSIKDKRNNTFTPKQLEFAKTYDPYWNAAQNQMIYTGKMHGYMRMYWGKKILEWNPRPEDAFKITLYLNNKYSIDGRDPNSFCGVAWCFGKHDRPWPHHKIFGNVRMMNAQGLDRKFNMKEYVRQIDEIVKAKK